jgi:hypothetical protein
LTLIIKDPEEKEADVTFHIAPHTVRRNDAGYVQFDIEGNVKAGLGGSNNLQQHAEIQSRKKANSLMEVNLELSSLDTFDPNSAQEDRQFISQGEEPDRPVFTGISLTEFDRTVAMVHEVGIGGMTQRQQLIAMLHTQSHLRIFRLWPDGGSKQLDTYRNWLQCAFMACGFFGYEWFYRLQMDQELDSVDVDYSALKSPRWLATEFKVTKNTQGEILSVEPC